MHNNRREQSLPYEQLTGDTVGRGVTPAGNLFLKYKGINMRYFTAPLFIQYIL